MMTTCQSSRVFCRRGWDEAGAEVRGADGGRSVKAVFLLKNKSAGLFPPRPAHERCTRAAITLLSMVWRTPKWGAVLGFRAEPDSASTERAKNATLSAFELQDVNMQ